MQQGQVTKNIMEYMNAWSERPFTYLEVSAIRSAIAEEYRERKARGLVIRVKTRDGRKQLDKRIADIANRNLGAKRIRPHEVRLYKQCFAQEYTDRTGRCAWGFKSVRKRLGFDENTGLEVSAI